MDTFKKLNKNYKNTIKITKTTKTLTKTENLNIDRNNFYQYQQCLKIIDAKKLLDLFLTFFFNLLIII